MTYTLALLVSNSGGPALAQGVAPDIPWVRIAVVLVLCIALAVAAIGFVRLRLGMPFLPTTWLLPFKPRLDQTVKEKRLHIVERLGVSPTSQFVVLARGKQRYLLLLTQQGATEIDRYEASEDGHER